MKISEAIEQLKAFKDQVGDVELVVVTDVDGQYIVENRDLDVVEILNEDETEMQTVVAFLESEDLSPKPLKVIQ